ncbi:MAG: hypothetical protein GY707_07960, partial [Desulfobacteraceae bacterium]|nr:hypothetical protein [Desulfobacteraceae bacterium]
MAKYPLLGKLAIKNKFLLKEDIDKALSVCSRDGDNLDKELSRYFISNKLISSKNIEKLVASIKEIEQIRPEVRFGAIAVKKGLVSKTNLDFIIEEQENDIINSREAKLLGDMLIEAGLITKGQRDSLIEAQKKILEKIPAKKRDDEEKKSLLMEAESVSCGLKLQISSDFLSAYLIKTEDFDEDCSIDDIEDILNDKDIIFGVVANE